MPDLPLSSGELAQMRHTVNAYLAGTIVVQAATKTSDGQGGYSWAYAAAGTYAGRVSPENLRGFADEAIVGMRLAEKTPYVATLASTVTIDEDDRLVYDGVTYEAIAVLTNVPTDIATRVRCIEVD